MKRREWVPDPKVMADEVIADYRNAEHGNDGDDAVLSRVTSWHAMAQAYGEELKEDDWIVLVQELAKRVVFGASDDD